ncbi:hypothetical protein ES703_107894 [subsurface metagenome]
MSNRNDLFKVLSGKKPDRIPCIHFGFWDEKAMHKLAPADCYDLNTLSLPSDDPPCIGYSKEPRTQESRNRAVRMAQHLDTAAIGVGKGGVIAFGHGGPTEIQPVVIERTGRYKILQYEGGHKRRVNYNPHSIRYYDFPVKEEEDLERLELPDMKNPERFADIEEDSRAFKGAGFVPTASIQGFFAGLHNSFMDFQDTMINLLDKPGFMKRFTEVLAKMSFDAVEMVMDRGIEIIDICDDLGNADGLLISPDLIRGFFIPWYEELVQIVHSRGGYVHLHSHGNISPVLPDFISIGIDIINPFDWEENPNLTELVETYGDRVIFCGGSVGDLYKHSPEEVGYIVRRACSLARVAEKGFIFMGNAGIEDLTLEQWESWRSISLRVREDCLKS